MFAKRLLDAGPTSTTLAQHLANVSVWTERRTGGLSVELTGWTASLSV